MGEKTIVELEELREFTWLVNKQTELYILKDLRMAKSKSFLIVYNFKHLSFYFYT